jgi:hypothetical protein
MAQHAPMGTRDQLRIGRDDIGAAVPQELAILLAGTGSIRIGPDTRTTRPGSTVIIMRNLCILLRVKLRFAAAGST